MIRPAGAESRAGSPSGSSASVAAASDHPEPVGPGSGSSTSTFPLGRTGLEEAEFSPPHPPAASASGRVGSDCQPPPQPPLAKGGSDSADELDDLVADLAAEYLAALEAGGAPSRQDFLDRAGKAGGDAAVAGLADVLDGIDMVNRAAAESRPSQSGLSPVVGPATTGPGAGRNGGHVDRHLVGQGPPTGGPRTSPRRAGSRGAELPNRDPRNGSAHRPAGPAAGRGGSSAAGPMFLAGVEFTGTGSSAAREGHAVGGEGGTWPVLGGLLAEPAGGTRLGDFRIVRELGRGGMGVVYEAEQTSLHRRVALKVLPPQSLSDPTQLARFRLEARAAALLQHPGIVPVYAVGSEGPIHYFAMQLVEGRSLDQVLRGVRAEAHGLLRPAKPPATPAMREAPRPGTSGNAGTAATPPDRSPASAGGSSDPAGESHPDHSADIVPDGVSDRPSATPPGIVAGPRPGVGATAGRLAGSLSGGSSRGPAGSSSGTGAEAWHVRLARLRRTRSADYFREVARIGAEAAEALDHAHQHGVVHRDIKPGNLLADATGKVMLADFGLALFRSAEEVTRTGDVFGTLRYMSPEQAVGRRGILDHRADVYSLGATLYEMLTLRPVFAGFEGDGVLDQVLHADPVPPRKVDAAVPADLETIVLRALAKNPAERWATAGEMAEDLRRWLADEPIRARPPGRWERTLRWCRRRPAVVASLAATVAVTLGASLTATALVVAANGEARRSADNERRAAENERRAAESERRRAEEAETRFTRARETVDLLVKIADEELDDRPMLADVRRKLLEAALQRYRLFAAERSDNPALKAAIAADGGKVSATLAELAAGRNLERLQLLGEESVLDDLALRDEPARGRAMELGRRARQVLQRFNDDGDRRGPGGPGDRAGGRDGPRFNGPGPKDDGPRPGDGPGSKGASPKGEPKTEPRPDLPPFADDGPPPPRPAPKGPAGKPDGPRFDPAGPGPKAEPKGDRPRFDGPGPKGDGPRFDGPRFEGPTGQPATKAEALAAARRTGMELQAEAEGLLSPGQMERLGQIDLHRRGAHAFSEGDVVERLGLTKGQRESLRAVEGRFVGRMMDAFRRRRPGQSGGPVGLDLTEYVALQRSAVAEAEELLTPAQRETWRAMVGRPFEGVLPPFGPMLPPPPRGPGGGLGGPGGGPGGGPPGGPGGAGRGDRGGGA